MSEIILYTASDNKTQIDVQFDNETVWLNRDQIATLFGRDIKTIGKHVNNVFKEEELDKKSVVAKFATTAILFSSPSLKTLVICFPMVFTSLPKSSAIWFLFNHTVSFSRETFSSNSPSL